MRSPDEIGQPAGLWWAWPPMTGLPARVSTWFRVCLPACLSACEGFQPFSHSSPFYPPIEQRQIFSSFYSVLPAPPLPPPPPPPPSLGFFSLRRLPGLPTARPRSLQRVSAQRRTEGVCACVKVCVCVLESVCG